MNIIKRAYWTNDRVLKVTEFPITSYVKAEGRIYFNDEHGDNNIREEDILVAKKRKNGRRSYKIYWTDEQSDIEAYTNLIKLIMDDYPDSCECEG